MKNNIPNLPGICFIGTNNPFSFSAFKTLCEHSVRIVQVILSGHAPASLPKKYLPVSTNNASDKQTLSLSQLAEQHSIPVTFLGYTDNRQQQWQQLCADATHLTRPDFIFVACFPEKLPNIVLSWPCEKSINLHPSLLPKYRGPDPIFWQLHQNEADTGISLHIISDELDAGPLLTQQAVPFPPDATHNELNRLLAHRGALAFVQLLTDGNFDTTPQDATQATQQPWPA